MAVLREDPYLQYNFVVDLGDGHTDGPQAGFSEMGALGMSAGVIEYRNGNERVNAPRKMAGLNRMGDVTFKRGIIGSLDLHRWLAQTSCSGRSAQRTVTVSLLNEDRSIAAQTWRLHGALIVKHVSGPFHALRDEVAVEEMVISFERLVIE